MTSFTRLLNRSVHGLVARAQMTLGMSHERFGTTLGSSKRTAARWAAGTSSPSVPQVCELARLVYPKDAGLAEELAAAASETLLTLGLVKPAVAPVHAEPQRSVPTAVLVDAVVCAAADATHAAPSVARATLLAAFRRARELRLTVEDVETALAANVVSLSR